MQGATFVSYQPERGEWRFDVEHFSRYGLIDADSDDEEPQPEKEDDAEDLPMPTEDQGSIAMLEGEQSGLLQACAGTKRSDSLDTMWLCCSCSPCCAVILYLCAESHGAACRSVIRSRSVLHGVSGDDNSGFEMIDGDDLDGMAEAEGAAADRQPDRRAAADQPLAVSLPASLGLEPARLSAMRTSLYADSRPLQVTNPLGPMHDSYGALTCLGASRRGAHLQFVAIAPLGAKGWPTVMLQPRDVPSVWCRGDKVVSRILVRPPAQPCQCRRPPFPTPGATPCLRCRRHGVQQHRDRYCHSC